MRLSGASPAKRGIDSLGSSLKMGFLTVPARCIFVLLFLAHGQLVEVGAAKIQPHYYLAIESSDKRLPNMEVMVRSDGRVWLPIGVGWIKLAGLDEIEAARLLSKRYDPESTVANVPAFTINIVARSAIVSLKVRDGIYRRSELTKSLTLINLCRLHGVRWFDAPVRITRQDKRVPILSRNTTRSIEYWETPSTVSRTFFCDEYTAEQLIFQPGDIIELGVRIDERGK